MINISFTADPLPADFKGTLQDFQSRFLLNLTGRISETQVIVGQVGGVKPSTNIGPWLNNDTWYVWNGSEYVPATIRVGGAGYTVQLGSATTVGVGVASAIADKVQTLQDKDGTIALLDDVYVGRPVVVLSGATPVIDWNLGRNFSETLPGNLTPTMVNSQDGQEIAIAFRNNATAYTITWPGNIFWTGGTAPVQTASKTDLYIIRNIGGSLLGRRTANY